MGSVAIGLDLLIHNMEYSEINNQFTSLEIICNDEKAVTVIPYNEEAIQGEIRSFEKNVQLMYVVDAFTAVKTWPVTLQLITPVETTAVGTVTLEAAPLICDSIANQGTSPVAKQRAGLRDFGDRIVTWVDFEMRIVFFKMTTKIPACQVINARPLNRAQQHKMISHTPSTSVSRLDIQSESGTPSFRKKISGPKPSKSMFNLPGIPTVQTDL